MKACNPHVEATCGYPTRGVPDGGGGFPLAWADHQTAPIIFFLSVILILHFTGEIIKYIREGRRH